MRTESSSPRGGITPGKRRTRTVPARDGSTSDYDHLTDAEEGVLDREYGEEVQWSRGPADMKHFRYVRKPDPMKPGDSWRQFLSSFRKYVDLVELYKKRMVPALFSYLHSSMVEKVLALKLSTVRMRY